MGGLNVVSTIGCRYILLEKSFASQIQECSIALVKLDCFAENAT